MEAYMKKLAEKVALVAELCIGLVFILTTILYMANAIPQYSEWRENGVLSVLMIVLALIFLGIAAYLLYVNLSDRENLKRILLFCDSESATHTNIKVVDNIVTGCAKQVDGIAIRKIRINSDEKGGFIASIFVKVSVDNVAESINKLRCLLTESFKNTLGLTFNTINFHIEKIRGKYVPNVKKAEEEAQQLTERQAETAENYEEPLATDSTPAEADVKTDVAEEKRDVKEETKRDEDDLIGA